MNIKKNVDLFILLLCFIIMIMSIVCIDKFGSRELFYLVITINLLITLATLKQGFDERFYPHYFEIIPNRHPNKYVKKRNCFLRSKEFGDYKEKINQRLDEERKMEEMDRKNMIFKNEIAKLVDMGNQNLDYIANGENF